MKSAFVLGAGLGNRLRPLTDQLPKPLVPLFHRPLAEWAMEACAASGIERFAINTHHLPKAWEGFGADFKITYFHEPILLETGGGLKNIAPWIGDESILVHNGDIFSTLPLGKLIEAHEASGLPVTLAVRSEGLEKRIALDESGTRVVDVRNLLDKAKGTHVFTGIYCVNAGFLDAIPADEKISVIPAFVELARIGKLGAVVLDDGVWLDLGDRASYLQAHRELNLGPSIHPSARVEPGAVIERSVIGQDAVVEAGAVIKNSVLWPGTRISADAVLEDCVAFSKHPISGHHRNEDL